MRLVRCAGCRLERHTVLVGQPTRVESQKARGHYPAPRERTRETPKARRARVLEAARVRWAKHRTANPETPAQRRERIQADRRARQNIWNARRRGEEPST